MFNQRRQLVAGLTQCCSAIRRSMRISLNGPKSRYSDVPLLGRGIIETDEFYRQCDEKGLMVYQEFPYWLGAARIPSDHPQVLDQASSSVVKRNRNSSFTCNVGRR